MGRLSRLALDWTPACLRGRDVKLDLYKHSLSATDGLPPYTQARIIELISSQLRMARAQPHLWVSVEALGGWYVRELRRLVKPKVPTAILPAGEAPESVWDFEANHYVYYQEPPAEAGVEHPFNPAEHGLKPGFLRILRILARLKTAHTPEITSLAGFSETYVRSLLKDLQAGGLIEWGRIGKYDGWAIKTKGLRLAHRSWNVPKGAHFATYRNEFRYAGERHRRVARLWRAWLETAYPMVTIWECWTEVSVRYGIPDALAWGHDSKREVLFWLEVDSGHSSRKVMERNYRRRLKLAYAHALTWRIPLVFCLLGPPWVVGWFPECIPYFENWVGVIGHDWREFGRLPECYFGQWRQDLEATHSRRAERAGSALSFDPAQYPPKPKAGKESKPPRPKSSKPRFYHPKTWDNNRHRRRERGEE